MSRDYALGKILCKGSGLKAYLEIKLSKGEYGNKEFKTFRYELGSLQSIMAQSNRQTSWNYVAGRSNPVGVNKGLRNVYGSVTFQQMDAGVLYHMFQDVKKWNAEKTGLTDSSLEGFSFTDFSLAEADAPLLSTAAEDLNIKLHQSELISLDDLPPVDLVVIGSADEIDPSTGIYEVNNTYMFRAKKVVFMSETFGMSAGAPLHNVATQVLILGGIDPWEVVK
ncbi:MAG: hypothetical protein ACRCX2_28775 [Paraclostridium sp.]